MELITDKDAPAKFSEAGGWYVICNWKNESLCCITKIISSNQYWMSQRGVLVPTKSLSHFSPSWSKSANIYWMWRQESSSSISKTRMLPRTKEPDKNDFQLKSCLHIDHKKSKELNSSVIFPKHALTLSLSLAFTILRRKANRASKSEDITIKTWSVWIHWLKSMNLLSIKVSGYKRTKHEKWRVIWKLNVVTIG